MKFIALELALLLVRALRGPLAALRRHDGDLAGQVRRAASSVPLALSEGRRRAGRDRLHLFRVAGGSAAEVETALRVAVAWGYLDAEDLSEVFALLDRLGAILWRLAH